MGRKALNYRQGRKSMKRVQQKACEVCLYLIWLLLTGSPKEQLFLFCSVAHKTKEHAKLEMTLAHVPSLRASSPDLKNSREVTLERHAKEARAFASRSRVLSRLALLARNGELARRLTYPSISVLLDSFCTSTKTI